MSHDSFVRDRLVRSGQFEETIHKSNGRLLTASAFPPSQYQLPIADVMVLGLLRTSSITEPGALPCLANNKRQVGASFIALFQ